METPEIVRCRVISIDPERAKHSPSIRKLHLFFDILVSQVTQRPASLRLSPHFNPLTSDPHRENRFGEIMLAAIQATEKKAVKEVFDKLQLSDW